MAAFFKTEFATDGVRVRALEKRSFGRVREIPRVDWPVAGLDGECLLELESLVENGSRSVYRQARRHRSRTASVTRSDFLRPLRSGYRSPWTEESKTLRRAEASLD
jgi:hypothetical protein